MLKDATYKEKFAMLARWMPAIVETVKKDLRNEHLKKDYAFVRYYFSGKNFNKLSTEELAQAYTHAIANGENAEELAEFVSNRWLLKHTDLYHYFEQQLTRINPNFSEIDLIDKSTSLNLMEDAIRQFGAAQTYLFCILNSVVFPDEIYELLNQRAEQNVQQTQVEAANQKELQSLEDMKRNCEQQVARLTDKYEKKLAGLQKKYTQDVANLKKQIVNLQRKLNPS
jgi:hypothetical protein